MTGNLVYTCPRCCTLVDYSCMCAEAPPISQLIGHQSVADAKAALDQAEALSTDQPRPQGKAPSDWYQWLRGFEDETGSIPRDKLPRIARAIAGVGLGFPLSTDQPRGVRVTDAQVNAFSREWSRMYPGRGMPDASQVRSLLEAASVSEAKPVAWRDVMAERQRQVEAEGWTSEHDDNHDRGQLARAAGIYALIAGADATNYRNAREGYGLGDCLAEVMELYWPWDRSWFKATTRRRDLVKAGALILAEIERLDRAALPPGKD